MTIIRNFIQTHPIHALLFDLNGTMVHDMPYHTRAWHQILYLLGLTSPMKTPKRVLRQKRRSHRKGHARPISTGCKNGNGLEKKQFTVENLKLNWALSPACLLSCRKLPNKI